jgi:hypothetical protein
MKIESPGDWFRAQSEHWDEMAPLLKNIIALSAVELAVLGVMSLYFGGM